MTSFSFRVMYFWSGILTSLTNVCRREAQEWVLIEGIRVIRFRGTVLLEGTHVHLLLALHKLVVCQHQGRS